MKKAIFTIAMVLALAGVAFASSAGGEGGGSHFKGDLYKVINFAILLGVLVYFVRKPFKEFLKTRTETIKKTLDEARQARELAEKALKEVQERLKYKDKELEEIVSASSRSGEAEKQALIAEGERLGAKIARQARVNMEMELQKARDAIRKEAVELAMELAEQKIRERLTPKEQAELLEESLRKLEGTN